VGLRIGIAGASALLIFSVFSTGLARAEVLLTVSPGPALPGGGRGTDDLLRWIQSTNGSTLGSYTITLDGLTVKGGSGLARDPQTDIIYALLKIQGRTFPELVTIDYTTGVATSIGNTTDRFAGIAFSDDGTLYAVSGDGGIMPETLYTLSTDDASATFLMILGNGSDGETLAFNPDDGLLYHASGIGNQNQAGNGEIFETIDPDTLDVTGVTLSGFNYEELTALVYVDGGFIAADLGGARVDDPGILQITPGGAVTFVADLDHVAKGLVGLPEPVQALQLLVGVAFLGVTARRRMRA